MSKRKSGCDFSELKALSNRIDTAVRFADTSFSQSRYSNQQILQAGASRLMRKVVQGTPKGVNGSNWYDYKYRKGDHSSHYFLKGRSHRAGTLQRGWVTDRTANPEHGARPTFAVVDSHVKRTPVQHKVKGISMTFHNVAPYSKAIEDGHWVRLPYFYGPPGTPRGGGPILPYKATHHVGFTYQAILQSEDAVRNVMKKECKKMLRGVMKG